MIVIFKMESQGIDGDAEGKNEDAEGFDVSVGWLLNDGYFDGKLLVEGLDDGDNDNVEYTTIEKGIVSEPMNSVSAAMIPLLVYLL